MHEVEGIPSHYWLPQSIGLSNSVTNPGHLTIRGFVPNFVGISGEAFLLLKKWT